MTDHTLLYTIPEAAALLRVSRDTLERRIRAGEIRAVKPSGGHRRIAAADLEAYINRLRGVEPASNRADTASNGASNADGKIRQITPGMRQSLARRARNAAKNGIGAAV